MEETSRVTRRPWMKPELKYRAINRYGREFYCDEKPVAYEGHWLTYSVGCEKVSETAYFASLEWTENNWQQSLQSYDDYQKLINQ